MTKVVINDCYGGFGLSDVGQARLWKRAPELFSPYTHESSERVLHGDDYTKAEVKTIEGVSIAMALEDRLVYGVVHEGLVYSMARYRTPELRSNPHLVAVVEEDAEAVSGRFARLKVVHVPNDVEWEVHEYDGHEHVAEVHRRWG